MPSTSGKNPSGYLVKLKDINCADCNNSNELCTMRECNMLCYHMYECDKLCYDYANGHLCKHIHRAHTIRKLEADCHLQFAAATDSANSLSDVESDLDTLEFAEHLRDPNTG